MKFVSVILFLVLVLGLAGAQDSVDVTFRYKPTNAVVRVFVPGEFNNWGPNSSGRIATNAPSLMTDEGGTWFKTIRLKIAGGSVSIGGENVYQYKFHEHLNNDGSSYNWLSDPLNPNINTGDNNNSYIAVKHPLIFQIEPTSGITVRNNQPAITASVAAKNSDSIAVDQSMVYLNGNLLGDFTGYYDTERQLLNIPSLDAFGAALQTGTNVIKIAAATITGVSRTDSVEFEYLPIPEIVDEPVPEGIVDGINYYPEDPTQVTLCLFAPYKKFVYVIGEFNDWELDADYLMKRDSTSTDSVRWWLTLTGLEPQKEYGFQYYVDDEIKIADPYTDKILDPWNDQYIDTQTYPNPKPYPTGETDQIVSVFQTGQTPYDWQIENFDRPDAEDLIIYELLIRDFVSRHNYQTLIDTLDYLENLGINAIELMPVNEFEGNISWGYNPSFYFAPDKYYGTKDKLKEFIDACHARGIAVILDMVLNHSTGQSPFVRLYNQGDYGWPTSENPWYNTQDMHPFSVFYDVNHESPLTKALVDRINAYWLTEYKVDGFRFDLSKGFTQTFTGSDVGAWGQYDASRVAILKRMADKIWETDPGAYVILEHFAVNEEERELANYGMLVWGKSNYNYNEATMGWHTDDNGNYGQSDFSWGYYENRFWNFPHLVTYMESHDEERLMYRNKVYGRFLGDYNTREIPTALQRMKMAAAFFFTLPGPKMIWQFGELGYDFSINYPTLTEESRTDPKPIRWDYFQDGNRRNLYKTYAALINLRKENAVFTEAQNVELDLLTEVKKIKLNHSSMNVNIIGNFGVDSAETLAGFDYNGKKRYEYFNGDSLDTPDFGRAIKLAAGEFRIYTDVKLDPPEEGILTDLELNEPGIPNTLALFQNYPNPFNPQTTIEYHLPGNSDVKLEIYSILGQKIITLVNGMQNAGSKRVIWNGTNQQGIRVASGVYFYRLAAGDQIRFKKMILLE